MKESKIWERLIGGVNQYTKKAARVKCKRKKEVGI